jgi:hypothetical protein
LWQSCPASNPRFLLLPPVRRACRPFSHPPSRQPSLTSYSLSTPAISFSRPPSPLSHEPKNRRTTQAGKFSTRGEGSVGNFSGVLEVISGRSHLNWAGNLDSPSPPPVVHSSSPPGICNYRVAFVDNCIRGFCQPGKAVSFRRRLRANFSLACTLDTLGGITVCVFPGWHISLPLQGPNIRFPRSHLRLHSNLPPFFFVTNGFFDIDELFTKSRQPSCSSILTF